MNSKSTLLVVFSIFVLISFFTFSYFASSIEEPLLIRQRFYNFFISMPEEVEVNAGDIAIIDGKITNTGMWWLRQFNFTLQGLPYEYEIIPQYWEEVRILRDWNPQDGVFRVPENFTIKIKVPTDAIGVHFVIITGQEFRSWRQVSNSSIFILKVIPKVPIQPNVTLSNIVFPEKVLANKVFMMNFTINNFWEFPLDMNVSVDLPADWITLQPLKSFSLEPNTSVKTNFTIFPTNTSGKISLILKYPFKQDILDITEVSPLLTPEEEIIEVPEVKPKPTGFAAIVEFIKNLSPIVIAVIILILIIVIWNIVKIYRFYRGRKRPEGKK